MLAGGNAGAAIYAKIIVDHHEIFPTNRLDRASFRATLTTRAAAAAVGAFTILPAAFIVINFNHIFI